MFSIPTQDLTLGVIVAALMTPTVGAQEPRPGAEANGLWHVSLTLSRPPSSALPSAPIAKVIDVAFFPDLFADAPQHLPLLAGRVGSRIRVGTLESHRDLRMGEIVPFAELGIHRLQAR